MMGGPISDLWATPFIAVWNLIALTVWLTAAIGLALPRSLDLRRGWASKLLWILALAVTLTIGPLWIPFGALFVLSQLRHGWDELDGVTASAPAGAPTS